MICDIHTFIEYRQKQDTEWKDGNLYTKGIEGFEKTFMKSEYRNYNLFTALANVRGTGGICDPRGLPNDVSREAFLAVGSWEGDAHSTSYFTLAELIKHSHEFPIIVELMNELDYYATVLNHSITPENIRIIFWFDN